MADAGSNDNTSQLQNLVRAVNDASQALQLSLSDVVTALNAVFPNSGGTTTAATAGGIASPGDFVGFIIVTLPDGTQAKVPYFA